MDFCARLENDARFIERVSGQGGIKWLIHTRLMGATPTAGLSTLWPSRDVLERRRGEGEEGKRKSGGEGRGEALRTRGQKPKVNPIIKATLPLLAQCE